MILRMIERATGEVMEAVANLQSLTDSRAFAATGQSNARKKAELAAQLIAIAAELDPALTAEREETLYSVMEAAERFGITKSALLAGVRRGTVPCVIVGAVGNRRLYIPESALVG